MVDDELVPKTLKNIFNVILTVQMKIFTGYLKSGYSLQDIGIGWHWARLQLNYLIFSTGRPPHMTSLFKTILTLGTLPSGRLTIVDGPLTALNTSAGTQPKYFKVFLWEGDAANHSIRSVFRFLANINSDNGVKKVWTVSSLVTLWCHLCLQMMLSFWHYRTVHWHSLQLWCDEWSTIKCQAVSVWEQSRQQNSCCFICRSLIIFNVLKTTEIKPVKCKSRVEWLCKLLIYWPTFIHSWSCVVLPDCLDLCLWFFKLRAIC